MKQLLTGLLFVFNPLYLYAQPEKPALTEDAPAGEALSVAHRFLAVYEGTWTEEVSLFATDGAEPEKFTLTTVINMVLGGRFLQCTRTGELHAAPFEGLTTIGYDKDSGLFTLCQISTESTATRIFEGRWKEPGTSIILQGSQNQMGYHNAATRMTITFEDKDNIRIENFEADDKGTLYKSREYHFSRQ
jgi:hypothetical protein